VITIAAMQHGGMVCCFLNRRVALDRHRRRQTTHLHTLTMSLAASLADPSMKPKARKDDLCRLLLDGQLTTADLIRWAAKADDVAQGPVSKPWSMQPRVVPNSQTKRAYGSQPGCSPATPRG